MTEASTDVGQEAPAAPADGAAPAPTTVVDVEEAMRDVIDPELGINVVDLGLIYGIQVDHRSCGSATSCGARRLVRPSVLFGY